MRRNGLRGIVQVKFLNDLVSAINDGWVVDDYGEKPRIDKTLDRRVRGLGKQKEENILVRPVTGDRITYSLGARNLWHNATASMDVDTSVSQHRLEIIMSAIVDILHGNVSRSGYVVWRVMGTTELSQVSGRNYYSGIVDVSCEAIDPQVTLE